MPLESNYMCVSCMMWEKMRRRREEQRNNEGDVENERESRRKSASEGKREA